MHCALQEKKLADEELVFTCQLIFIGLRLRVVLYQCPLITTGSFAKAALDIEKNNIKLELIDGEKLVAMFEKVELGVTPKTIYEPNMTFFEQYRDLKSS